MRNDFWYPIKMLPIKLTLFQLCNSNAVAFNPFAFFFCTKFPIAILWIFLYCSLSSYCDSNSWHSFSILSAISKSKGKREKSDNYLDIWKSENYRKGNKEKQQRIYSRKEAKKIKCDNFTRSNREKFKIAIAEKLIIR